MQPKSAGWPAPLTASTFNRLGHCANSPGSRAYSYAELAVSSLAVAVTIASTHYAYPQRDGQAEWAWVAWLDTKTVYPRTVTHLSTNPARRRATSLIRPTTLPLSQTATTQDVYHIHALGFCSTGPFSRVTPGYDRSLKVKFCDFHPIMFNNNHWRM